MSGEADPPLVHPANAAETSTSGHSIAGILFHASDADAANIRIMTAAVIVLLAVIVFILGLHLYTKWFWTNVQIQRHTYHLEFALEEALHSNDVGLDKGVFDSLPKFKYSKGLTSKLGVECAVCLCEFEEKESGRQLPKCNHIFHGECIGMWFKSHSTCPLCRLSVLSLDHNSKITTS